MSMGGGGVINLEALVEVGRPAGQALEFIPRRFRVGGNLHVKDGPGIENTRMTSCVLCGGIILNDDYNLEHPLPQWLHRFAGDAGEKRPMSFSRLESLKPTWRQLCLSSHKHCNKTFAQKIEDPAISAVKSIVDGKKISWTEIDRFLDWMDKINSTSAHMATALMGHNLILDYSHHNFPNKRIGLFDRVAILFRIENPIQPLNLWDCFNEGYLTTASALILQVKDLVIVYISSNYLLSSTFGLGMVRIIDGESIFSTGGGMFSPGFGSRRTRLTAAKIIAQPMRRQHVNGGLIDKSSALQANGDGRIYELMGTRWSRIKSSDFSNLPKLNSNIGLTLAALEFVEWLILCKESDYQRYGTPGSIFMRSMSNLTKQKLFLMEQLAHLRGGITINRDDRL